MKKVIIKTGSVQVEAHIKTPSTTNKREMIAPDSAAAFPSKDEIVQVIEIGYTVFQAFKILFNSIKGWFKKPTA